MDQNYEKKEYADLSWMLKTSRLSIDKQKDRDLFYGERVGDSKIVKLLVKYSGGLVKDRRQANIFLLSVFILAIIILFFVIISSRGPKIAEKNIFNPKRAGKDIDTMRF